MYRQRITKSSVLTFWRKALCRTVSLYFQKEIQMDGILAYKYILHPDMYDRKPKNETDCYRGAIVELPNGLTDVSKCYFSKSLVLYIFNFVFGYINRFFK